ncbi:Na/Pi cotransporter family protein [Oceanivirga miroungae]|uniref:Na/Pi-cotransporter II-like protein n=1 Tax=Oceanivirga miroungae TaxID=1130046 RepID=A0A6I8M802_9FUSO|nr:Na/Pi cotransporter family protein [Oceanivirga miroungae]VWL85631.1 Na/Pi-cotransporter II-like protein [Oceanivirga miroungae]
MNYSAILFPFLGGLGLFLFSIKYMGDGLQLAAGDKLRYILDKYTTNPFLGVLTGILVTALIQSSSGTTVITIGLVAAGFLSLRQAIGIIMGANVGTTVTSFIIGFNLSAYALPIIFIGSVLLFFVKNERLNNIGRVLFGFGGIFYALKLMSGSFVPLRSSQVFMDMMVNLSHSSILGVFVGTFLTVVIQSSSATIGILQGLYQEGLIPLNASLPILFGDNIGTTITAILACIGSTNIAKRVALSHVLFNLIGTVIFVIFLTPFAYFIEYMQVLLHLSPKLTIAFAHGSFNIVNVLIQFPFIGLLAYIVTKIIPEKEDEKVYQAEYLDRNLLESAPILALSQAKKEVIVMLKKSIANLNRASEYFDTRNPKLAEKAITREEEINNLDHDITTYLTDLFKQPMSEKNSEIISSILDSTRDIERIGDHAIGLVNDVKYQVKKELDFSDSAREEVVILHSIANEMLQKTIISLEKNDKNMAIEALDIHNRIYVYEKKVRKKHISRMNDGKCGIKAGLYYVDVINHFTRICDHARNINEKVLNDQI